MRILIVFLCYFHNKKPLVVPKKKNSFFEVQFMRARGVVKMNTRSNNWRQKKNQVLQQYLGEVGVKSTTN
jgi:hypothetical protein